MFYMFSMKEDDVIKQPAQLIGDVSVTLVPSSGLLTTQKSGFISNAKHILEFANQEHAVYSTHIWHMVMIKNSHFIDMYLKNIYLLKYAEMWGSVKLIQPDECGILYIIRNLIFFN